jgi:inner membrane protein
MNFALGKRVVLMLLLGIGLMIPMTMITGLIAERQNAQRGVLSDVAQSSTGEQSIMGPVLVVPYKRKLIQTQIVKDEKGVEREKKVRTDSRRDTDFFARSAGDRRRCQHL